ncbi:MAG: HAD hydrolase family protein, partial [Butyrivibrio sp.]|nr:HAD hydrolase family protein [Butyrivibrio sp.]
MPYCGGVNSGYLQKNNLRRVVRLWKYNGRLLLYVKGIEQVGSKIFFFDLDGTLLNSKKTITEKTMDALRKFTDAGNHFCI